MTEDEAKTKWCPYARTVATIANTEQMTNSFNREHRYRGQNEIAADMIIPESCTCIGSDCMAWRWSIEGPEPRAFMECPSLKHAQWVVGRPYEEGEDGADGAEGVIGGYCGLAGRLSP